MSLAREINTPRPVRDDASPSVAAWEQLRLAIAYEFADKLPERLTLSGLAALTHRSLQQIAADIDDGSLVARETSRGRIIRPRDNIEYFQREILISLPVPGRLRVVGADAYSPGGII